MAGRLTGTVDGSPVVISADERGIVIRFERLRSAWRLRQSAAAVLPLFDVLRFTGIPVELQVGTAGWAVPLLPQPHFLATLLVPALSRLRQPGR